MSKITADAWRTELERVMQKAGDEGMTAGEIQEITGMSRHVTSVRLSALHKLGRIRSGRRFIAGKDGISRPIPVYVILKEKKR